MSLTRKTYVLGGHITKFIGSRHPDFIWKKHPEFGKKENPILEDYIDEAVNGALENTGVKAESIEKAWIGNFCGELFSNQGHLGAAVVGANPGLMHKPVMRVEGACASGGLRESKISSGVEGHSYGSAKRTTGPNGVRNQQDHVSDPGAYSLCGSEPGYQPNAVPRHCR